MKSKKEIIERLESLKKDFEELDEESQFEEWYISHISALQWVLRSDEDKIYEKVINLGYYLSGLQLKIEKLDDVIDELENDETIKRKLKNKLQLIEFSLHNEVWDEFIQLKNEMSEPSSDDGGNENGQRPEER